MLNNDKDRKREPIKIGDVVYYYPTKKESSGCNFADIIAGDVVKVLPRGLLNIKLRCDGNKDLTVRSISRKSTEKEEGVWDYRD